MKYPRPQLKRDSFTSLDGEWLINGKTGTVPSCRQEQELSYVKEFEFIKQNERTILHFGAVDQIANVTLNKKELGSHVGGYLPFEFDITDIVKEGKNTLEVNVIDHLDQTYPYGKQTLKPSGMWYTPVTGIWQSVWYEQVPDEYIRNIKITPDLNGVDIDMYVSDCDEAIHQRIDEDNPILWSPENPYLYYRTLEYKNDKVEIYYALRKIDIQNIDGINRVCLNNKPIIINGVLDQGYWKDTLFIPDSENGYETDILNIKGLGFNTLRKHIKIEPEEFYYECDRLGMLVIQDMVQTGKYKFFRDTVLSTIGFNFSDRVNRLSEAQKFYIEHAKATQTHLYNHPCIIAYTIFNEGWGQFNADEMYDLLKPLDPSRLYDSTSGWFKQHKSDFDSLHIYFRLKDIKPETRPMLVSECGGFILDREGKATWGYGKCDDEDALTSKIEELYNVMIIPKIKDGCCGCIYTQVSDVEGEMNGLYSFDRKQCKVIKDRLNKLFEALKV